MKELIRNQGFAVTLLFLILIPVIFFAFISIMEITNVVQAGDMDMQEGMVLATKASAEQVDMTYHSRNMFFVNPAQAINIYQKMIAYNLGLDEATLAPITDQYISPPRFCLLVYNGADTGAIANKKYQFDGTDLTDSLFEQVGFPKTFIIQDLDILVGAGEDSITLNEPGVIAVMQIDQKNLLGDGNRTITRWAAAVIKTRN